MKKEIFAAALLIIVLAVSFLNILFLSRIADELTVLIDEAADAIQRDDWDAAVSKAETAVQKWLDSTDYANIILHHNEINYTTETLYRLLLLTHSEQRGEASVAADMAKEQVEGLLEMEKVRLGSIL